MNKLPTLAEMLKAGVHFGHQKSRWHPKMAQYIFGARGNVHIIDLDKTLEKLQAALDYLKTLASKGKVILFVGTKRQAREAVKAAAISCGMPYLIERWIGGLLTNFEELQRRLKKYKSLKDMVATGEIEKYTKKEQVRFKKQIDKMDRYLIGLTTLDKRPDAIYLADLKVEKTAVTEARRREIPVVAVCDTNVDPGKVAYAIPANDDAVNSIKMVVDLIAEAVKEGLGDWEKNKIILREKEAAERAANVNLKSAAALPKTGTTAERKERRVIRTEEVV